jgi:membrane-associated protein
MDITLQSFSFLHGYQGLFIICLALYIGCLGTPLNSDLIMFFSGILVSQGVFQKEILIVLCILSILSGDSTLFLMARKYGKRLFELPLFTKVFTTRRLELAASFLKKWGSGLIVLVRLTPGIRSVTFFKAGASGVPFKKYFLYNFLAISIWSIFMINLGYYAGENYELVLSTFKKYQLIILSLVLVIVFVAIFNSSKRKS